MTPRHHYRELAQRGLAAHLEQLSTNAAYRRAVAWLAAAVATQTSRSGLLRALALGLLALIRTLRRPQPVRTHPVTDQKEII